MLKACGAEDDIETMLRFFALADQQDDDKSRILVIFLAISAIVVLIAVIGLVAIIVFGKMSPSTSGSSAASPYNLKARPLPELKTLNDLLPPQLGSYKRTASTGDMQDFSATYVKEDHKIVLTGSQAVNVRAAQVGVKNAASSGGFTAEELDQDPSYFLSAPANGPARYVWSHNRWFFDIKASSKAALDDFMTVFKY
jgi:hypothetical protein